jgi:hypothetical protein
MYCTVPPGGAVGPTAPLAARCAPAASVPAAAPFPATAGIAHRNKVAAQPQNAAEHAATAVPA